LRVEIGVATQKGRRAKNEDYVAACFGGPADQKIVAALADGLGGYKGGREAAEITVRAFIDGFFSFPHLAVARAASRALDAVNGWIAAQRRVDAKLAGMATTFTALIFAGRCGHVVHVGDSRAYCLSQGRLQQLTSDHTAETGEVALALGRAVGFEPHIRLDHQAFALRTRDRFLLCSDGVHGVLSAPQLQSLLESGAASQASADAIVAAALQAGSTDNVSAVVVDIIDLPLVEARDLTRRFAALPLGAPPEPGDIIDNFRLEAILAEGPQRRVLSACDLANGERLALSFPQPCPAEREAACRAAFVAEAWASSRARSPDIGEIIEIAPERQTRLYGAAPLHEGETLERRLRRQPAIVLAEGLQIAMRLAQAVAHLHRCGIIHRDIRPKNVLLLKDGGVRLVGLSRASLPGDEGASTFDESEFHSPELRAGGFADESADLYALGVTIYRMFADAAPYGDEQRAATPRFRPATPLTAHRPDLPGWLDHVLANAYALDRVDCYGDVLEFAFELENGARATPPAKRKKAFYDRNPVLFWQAISGVLFILLVAMAMRR
jgi:serine/threonine protein phosphatase PrpC